MLFAEAFLLRHDRKAVVSPWQGDCTGPNRVLFLAEDLLLGILHPLLLLQVFLPHVFAGDVFHVFRGEPASLPV